MNIYYLFSNSSMYHLVVVSVSKIIQSLSDLSSEVASGVFSRLSFFGFLPSTSPGLRSSKSAGERLGSLIPSSSFILPTSFNSQGKQSCHVISCRVVSCRVMSSHIIYHIHIIKIFKNPITTDTRQ